MKARKVYLVFTIRWSLVQVEPKTFHCDIIIKQMPTVYVNEYYGYLFFIRGIFNMTCKYCNIKTRLLDKKISSNGILGKWLVGNHRNHS